MFAVIEVPDGCTYNDVHRELETNAAVLGVRFVAQDYAPVDPNILEEPNPNLALIFYGCEWAPDRDEIVRNWTQSNWLEGDLFDGIKYPLTALTKQNIIDMYLSTFDGILTLIKISDVEDSPEGSFHLQFRYNGIPRRILNLVFEPVDQEVTT